MSNTTTTPGKTDRLERTISGVRSLGEENRAFELSFSSEEPYERRGWFGDSVEILDHGAGAADLSRLQELGVLLFNHNRDAVIGKVRAVSVENNRGVATVEFDDDAEAERIYQKVRSGTLKGVSVGYTVNSWEEIKAGKQSADGRFTGPAMIARSWQPLEISIVSVPADAGVGVGRDYSTTQNEEDVTHMENELDTSLERGAAQTTGQQTTQTPPDENAIRAAERQRTGEIMSLCRDFNIDPASYVTSGASVDQVRAAVLDELKKTHAPINVSVERDEGDKIRDAARDGLLLRGGVPVDKPAEGAQRFRSLHLRDLAIECCTRGGGTNAHMLTDDELIRAFFTPTSLFPSIMDDTIQKAYVAGIKTVPVTFDKWTTKGSLSDFKSTQSRWQMGEAGELLLVPEGGELKHDIPQDERTPTRKLSTYGRQFTMTREAFINDDISFLTSLPARGEYEKAIALCEEAYKIFINKFGENHPSSKTIEDNLKIVYRLIAE